MFYSHSLEDNKFDFFVSFLIYIVKGDLSYVNLVTPIIKDAHELANGQKDFYSIDRNNFPIIVHLVETEREYFRALNADHLTTDQYQHILNLVSQQREVAVV
ncbi:hypothetical protein [Chitinophaga sp. CB10]|uniref:hypothetical protein n=1 Tax=Chitinophaga sp. CB10 TaxID=1891659 RepID=UPI0025B8FE32|nr:hypothetical protein [Chitinophaga sp. CB10]